jgi:hypothetical protein
MAANLTATELEPQFEFSCPKGGLRQGSCMTEAHIE